MPKITFESASYEVLDGETVLECLERQGVAIASSCRSGVCQSCLLRAEEGPVPPLAQKGLRDTLRAQQYLLSCSCRPEADMRLERGAGQRTYRGIIESIDALNEGVVRLRIRPAETFAYYPGQFLNLHHASGHVRSYSIASTGDEPWLELHIGLLPGGCVSTWLRDEAAAGDEVSFSGPLGNCFYLAGNQEQPLLLAGTGTGLAPLYGIAREALRRGHTGPIHLFHGALTQDRLYLAEELRRLAREHANFNYIPSVVHAPVPAGVVQGPLDQVVLEAFPSLKGWRVFLCGHPDLVKQLQRQTFLAGASMKEILADAFLPAAASAEAAHI